MYKRPRPAKPRIIRTTAPANSEAQVPEPQPAFSAELDREISANVVKHSALGILVYRKSDDDRALADHENNPELCCDGQREWPEELHGGGGWQENSDQSQEKLQRVRLEDVVMGPAKGPAYRVILPGIADMVESYPCRACPDQRVFLTRAGLEKHAKEQHPDRIGELVETAEKIQTEWDWRKRVKQHQKPISEVPENAFNLDQVDASGSDGLMFGQKRNLQECTRCNTLIDASRRGQLQQHVAEHHHNDQLRAELECTYGIEAVQQLFCSHCDMVFADAPQLHEHNRVAHAPEPEPTSAQSRRFICRWCAKFFPGIGALNVHKERAHGIGLDPENPQAPCRDPDDGPLQSDDLLPIVLRAEVPARVQCHLCGLVMVRPSLLIRHMARVHSRHCDYSANVVYPMAPLGTTMPALRYMVDEHGQLIWICCGQSFMDKDILLEHRSRVHNMPPPWPLPPAEQQRQTNDHNSLILNGQMIYYNTRQQQRQTHYNHQQHLSSSRMDDNGLNGYNSISRMEMDGPYPYHHSGGTFGYKDDHESFFYKNSSIL